MNGIVRLTLVSFSLVVFFVINGYSSDVFIKNK